MLATIIHRRGVNQIKLDYWNVRSVLSKSFCGDDIVPGNTLDFHQHVLGKPGHFDGRPGGLVIAERLLVDAVDGNKVVHRLEEYLRKL